MSDRPENGPMEFDGDWRGVFLRGDYAGPMTMYWRLIYDYLQKPNPTPQDKDQIVIALMYVNGLMEILAESNQWAKVEVQKMKAFKDCIKDGGK